MDRYNIQWINKRTIVYNFHRYLLSLRQPDELKLHELQFSCYAACNHYIRIRQKSDEQWVVTKLKMHDSEACLVHSAAYHELYTPQREHLEVVKEVATQDLQLYGDSARSVAESQVLQEPTLNEIHSVNTLKRKIASLASRLVTKAEYPPTPTCAPSAAQSLRTNPIWAQDFYAHCKTMLEKKLKDMNDGNDDIHLHFNISDVLSSDPLQGQLALGKVMLQLNELRDILKLQRTYANQNQTTFDAPYFLIHMRLDGSLILFGHEFSFHALKDCTCVGFDQLCRICPLLANTKIWSQSWILHALYETNDVVMMDENFPCFVALMTDHKEAAYDEILNAIQDFALKNEVFDESFARNPCITSKAVRIMGDWSLAEHNALMNSDRIDVEEDSGCGWHFIMINAINDNLKKRNVIQFYYNDENFRTFIRFFETIRGIHLDCAELACELIYTAAMVALTGDAKDAFQEFYETYLLPMWKNQYGFQRICCQGSFVMDNNFCEGYNAKYLLDLGIHKVWWEFLLNLKRFFAVTAARYATFMKKRFERKRSPERQERCRALKKIWDVFEHKDRTDKHVVWQYIQCLFHCWENEYEQLETMLSCL